jgi:hypothetical protein
MMSRNPGEIFLEAQKHEVERLAGYGYCIRKTSTSGLDDIHRGSRGHPKYTNG